MIITKTCDQTDEINENLHLIKITTVWYIINYLFSYQLIISSNSFLIIMFRLCIPSVQENGRVKILYVPLYPQRRVDLLYWRRLCIALFQYTVTSKLENTIAVRENYCICVGGLKGSTAL